MKACTDCRSFIGCKKNCEEWEKVKEKYPVTSEEADLNHHPMIMREKLRLYHINDIAAKCEEFRQNPIMGG